MRARSRTRATSSSRIRPATSAILRTGRPPPPHPRAARRHSRRRDCGGIGAHEPALPRSAPAVDPSGLDAAAVRPAAGRHPGRSPGCTTSTTPGSALPPQVVRRHDGRAPAPRGGDRRLRGARRGGRAGSTRSTPRCGRAGRHRRPAHRAHDQRHRLLAARLPLGAARRRATACWSRRRSTRATSSPCSPPSRRLGRRRSSAVPDDADRGARRRGAARDARRAGEGRRGHPRAQPERPAQPGRGDRSRAARERLDGLVPPRRVPVDRADAARRRRDRRRLPLRHRPQVPARPARHGLPLRLRPGAAPSSPPSSTCTPRPGPRSTPTRWSTARRASRTGRSPTPPCSGSAPPPTTRSTSASTSRRRASPGSPTGSAPTSPRCPASSCATAATQRTGIVVFSVDGHDRRRRRPPHQGRRRQREPLPARPTPSATSTPRASTGRVRVSPHVYTDDTDLEALVDRSKHPHLAQPAHRQDREHRAT